MVVGHQRYHVLHLVMSPQSLLLSSAIPSEGESTAFRLPEVLAWLCCWTLRCCEPPEK